MNKFPMVEKLGLILRAYPEGYAVLAEDLEYILQSAQTIYGYGGQWSGEPSSNDTAMALIIDVKPIKKKTKAEAALELLSKITNDGFHLPNNADIVQQAKRILEMKDDE